MHLMLQFILIQYIVDKQVNINYVSCYACDLYIC